MDAAIRALGEPTRRQILTLVRDGERTASDIASHFDVTRPAISQHLRVLTDADLVTVRAEGTRRYYRARPEGLAELNRWLEGFWTSSLSNLRVEVEREQWNARKRAQRSGEPTAQRSGEPTAQRSGEPTAQRSGEPTAQRSGEEEA